MSALTTLAGRLQRALQLSDPAVLRLGGADTSVAFVNGGERVTLLLDREPPEISDLEDAEIIVQMDADLTREFARGRVVLSTSLIDGEATYSGPVRKYLEVDPILRGLLTRVDGEEG